MYKAIPKYHGNAALGPFLCAARFPTLVPLRTDHDHLFCASRRSDRWMDLFNATGAVTTIQIIRSGVLAVYFLAIYEWLET